MFPTDHLEFKKEITATVLPDLERISRIVALEFQIRKENTLKSILTMQYLAAPTMESNILEILGRRWLARVDRVYLSLIETPPPKNEGP